METKQLNEYKITFISDEEASRPFNVNSLQFLLGFSALEKAEYYGKVSDISEELAEKIVDKINIIDRVCIDGSLYDTTDYFDYYINKYSDNIKEAKESFQTLSELKYCVITKIINNEKSK